MLQLLFLALAAIFLALVFARGFLVGGHRHGAAVEDVVPIDDRRARAGFLKILGAVVAVVFYSGGALAAGDVVGPSGGGFAIDGVLRFIAEHFGAILLFATPLVLAAVAALFAKLNRPQQDTLLGAVKGAYSILAAIAPSTPMAWDDAVATLLEKVAADMGRKLKPKEVARVKSIAASLLADPSRGDIVVGNVKIDVLKRAARR